VTSLAIAAGLYFTILGVLLVAVTVVVLGGRRGR
jgi:hypothetical protein